MKTFLWAAALCLVAAGCNQNPADKGATPRAQTSPLASVATPSGVSPGCATEIAVLCPEQFVDGCLSKVTTTHACVPRATTTAGPGCHDDILLTCPSGQRDACSAPVVSDRHVCVLQR